MENIVNDMYPIVEWKWVLLKDLPFVSAGTVLGMEVSNKGRNGYIIQNKKDEDGDWKYFSDSEDCILEKIFDNEEWIKTIARISISMPVGEDVK